tara:strand:+ start:1309 stop:1614 length:306 start_codon:yes stop_codon:yes gene_type:complete
MMKDRYESGDLARERDEKVIRPANPKNMDPSAGVNWAQMEPHDVLDQIDVMLDSYKEGMALLHNLRRQVAKEARYRWAEGVNGFGQQVQYKVPINQDGSDR